MTKLRNYWYKHFSIFGEVCIVCNEVKNWFLLKYVGVAMATVVNSHICICVIS